MLVVFSAMVRVALDHLLTAVSNPHLDGVHWDFRLHQNRHAAMPNARALGLRALAMMADISAPVNHRTFVLVFIRCLRAFSCFILPFG